MYANILNKKPFVITLVLGIMLGFVVINLSVLKIYLNNNFFLKLILIYGLSIFLIYKIQNKFSFYLPSFYLFCFFSIIPVYGVIGYNSYKKIYGDYLGVYLDMNHALDMWLQGTFFLFLGIYLVHIVSKIVIKIKNKTSSKGRYLSWDWERYNYILFFLAGISIIFTIVVIWKLGYIPILKGNIEKERFFYYERAGDWPMKLSRLWLPLYFFVFIKLVKKIKEDGGFYIRRNISVIILILTSLFFMGIYGERYYHFVVAIFSIIIVNKYLMKIKITHLIIFFILVLILANFIVYIRDINYKESNYSIIDKALINSFGEFRAFAHVVQEYPKRDFLNGKAFIAAVAPVFPKQVWAAFNINKDKLMRYNSAAVMKRIHGHYSGIRVGIIGEGYINFGYVGILIIPFLAGLLFGLLENIFVSLPEFDIKELAVAFAISLISFLPLAQSNVFTNVFFFNMYFIVFFMIFFKREKIYMATKNRLRQLLSANLPS